MSTAPTARKARAVGINHVALEQLRAKGMAPAD